jgi:hypothetical protein
VDRAFQPGHPTGTNPAVDATCRAPAPDDSTTVHCRSKATGDEAVNLVEAACRVEAVASLLAHIALDHASSDDLLLPMIRLLDDAKNLVERS